MIEKQRAYRTLVQKRKAFRFAELLNPSEIEGGRYDCDHVELWARWLGNLNAKIMLVGKDFGGKKFFIEFKGGCNPKSVTNLNLIKLFACLGINIGTPSMPDQDVPVFMTNAIIGIIDTSSKGGNRISSLSKRESTSEFLRPLIDIVDPSIIIAMGKEAYECVCNAFGVVHARSMREALEIGPVELPNSKLLFPVFHCGGLGVLPQNRTLNKQIEDWSRIARYL